MFGQGPRNCIGMRYALLALKIAFVFMLRKYRLVPCSKTTKEIEVNHSFTVNFWLNKKIASVVNILAF
jgi:cytochrome P450